MIVVGTAVQSVVMTVVGKVEWSVEWTVAMLAEPTAWMLAGGREW